MFNKKFKVRLAPYTDNTVCVQYSYSRFNDNWYGIRKITEYSHMRNIIGVAFFDNIDEAKKFTSKFKSYQDVLDHEKEIDDYIESERLVPENYTEIIYESK